MKQPWIMAAVLLFASLPVAGAEDGMEASGVHGGGAISLSADNPMLLVPGSEATSVALQSGNTTTIHWRDDYFQEVKDREGLPSLTSWYQDRSKPPRHETASGVVGLKAWAGAERPEDAVLLVMPLESGVFTAQTTHRGSYSVFPVEEEILEHSHAVDPDRQSIHSDDQDRYYEYRVQDTLGIRLSGQGNHTVRGDFLLYLWSFGYRFDGGGPSSDVHRTGEWVSPHPENPFLQERHHAFALIEARDAVLHIQASKASSVHSDQIMASVVGETEYSEASGSVPSTHGTYEAAGTVVVRDGTAVWKEASGQVGVAFPSPATQVSGSITHVPTTGGGSWLAWFALVGAAAVLASAWATPHAFAGLGSGGFRTHRAEGFSRMALAAEARSRLGLASALAGRASRWEPDNPTHLIDRASYLEKRGRSVHALRCHERAHGLLEHTCEDATIARNAYEAARVAGRIGAASSEDWLRIALNHEPILADVAPRDPVLGQTLRSMRRIEWDDLVRP